jgi:hypothetical protein
MSRLPSRAIVVACALVLPAISPAQLIQIKTVPVAQGDQFDIFPSRNMAMGGVSIALRDPLLDPFVNPATAARVKDGLVAGAPGMFSVSEDAGGGRTLPVSVIHQSKSWFGGLALALQEIDGARPFRGPFPPGPIVALSSIAPEIPQPAPQRTHGNRLAFALLGTSLENAGVSLGASVQWAELNGVDGVEFLYAQSQDVAQFGHIVDARLGLLKEWAGDRSLEATLVHNRVDMTHDVTYADFFWDPTQQQIVTRPRVEHNVDRTFTWGAHLEYDQPIPGTAWRGGARFTANVASHPKIPNYEIMNIPRDPGRSHAYDLGVGFARTEGGTTFGIDAIFEPIRSHTWADAATAVGTSTGDTLAAGARTIENWFRFSNAILRFGLTEEHPVDESDAVVALQFGVAVRSINYRLHQVDHVQGTQRRLRESWREWMPTWGLRWEMPRLAIGYRGSITTGTGRPGVVRRGFGGDVVAVAESNILIAPSGPIALGRVNVVSHQLSISLPIH